MNPFELARAELFTPWEVERVLAGEAGWNAVFEVLPGIGLMATILVTVVGWWRHTQRRRAQALIEELRRCLDGSHTSSQSVPFMPRPIS